MLAVGVVDQHHREFQLAGLVHRLEPQDSCGGLLASAYDIGYQLPVLGMNHIHKVAAIVNDDVRTGRDDLADSVHVFFGGGSVDCEYIQSLVYKRRRDVILRRERIAAGDVHLGSACGEHLTEMCRLGFKMH